MKTIDTKEFARRLRAWAEEHSPQDEFDVARGKAFVLKDVGIVDAEGNALDPDDIEVDIAIGPKGKADDEDMPPEEEDTKSLQTLIKKAVAEAMPDREKAAKAGRARTGSDVSVKVRDRLEDDDRYGFKSVADFCMTAMAERSGRIDGISESRQKGLKLARAKAATVFQQESVGADGGFLVPPGFSNEILTHVQEEAIFVNVTGGTGQATFPQVAQTSNTPLTGNSISIPVQDSLAWDSTGAVPERVSEAGIKPSKKMPFRLVDLKLNKVAALVEATDELLEDTTALESVIREHVGQKFTWEINNQVIRGTGIGEGLGILNSGATVAAAQAGTTAAVEASDILSMYSRMYGPWRRGAVWLYNQELEPQMYTMKVGDVPVFLPPNGLADRPFNTIMGLPAFPSQFCEEANTPGDIMFSNFSHMRSATKASGLKSASSIHFRFDQDIVTWRFEFRFDCQPWLTEAITPANSSTTLSPFVTLATRTGS